MLSGVSLSQWRSTILTPALFTRISSRPSVTRMKSPTLRTSSALVRSAGCTSARPVWLMRRATSSSGLTRLPVSTIVAPASASASAAASPIPLPAPVTHATFPARLVVIRPLPLHPILGPTSHEQECKPRRSAIRCSVNAIMSEREMLDHITMGVTDADGAKSFYDQALRPLGINRLRDEAETFAGYGSGGKAYFWIGLRAT